VELTKQAGEHLTVFAELAVSMNITALPLSPMAYLR
jgi:hypothetical protein